MKITLFLCIHKQCRYIFPESRPNFSFFQRVRIRSFTSCLYPTCLSFVFTTHIYTCISLIHEHTKRYTLILFDRIFVRNDENVWDDLLVIDPHQKMELWWLERISEAPHGWSLDLLGLTPWWYHQYFWTIYPKTTIKRCTLKLKLWSTGPLYIPANSDNRRRLKYLYDTVSTGTPAWKKMILVHIGRFPFRSLHRQTRLCLYQKKQNASRWSAFHSRQQRQSRRY